MFRDFRFRRAAAVSAGMVLLAAGALAQEQRRARIDVLDYTIDAEISPNTSDIQAKATVRFTPLDDGITSTSFELNNALNVSRVTDSQGKQIQASRNQQDFSVRLNFDQPLVKGQPVSVTFYYDGRLTGQEDSPVYGIKFAAIHPDFSFLMYPARWFPVAGYTTDRFAADLKVTVPMGYSVIGSGLDSHQTSADKNVCEFKLDQPSFPGSIAVVKDQPVKVQSEGATMAMYFRGPEAAMTQEYGTEAGKILSYFTATYGLPLSANLSIVETEAGAPNGYAAPGILFLAPNAITQNLNSRLLANEVSRQWWEDLVSPTTRNHLWLENEMVGALTIDNVPIIQSARLDDYSPELWALTGSKGAAVLNMLRYVVGDAKFFQILKNYEQQYAWKSASTDDFEKITDDVTGEKLDYFFIQWIESSLSPEFKLDYTIYRVGNKGFRVMGKISQDVDTFRMPVELKIVTEGNPESKRIEVVGTSSEFSVDTFGKPVSVVIDPDNMVLRWDPQVRVAVAIRRGEQFAQMSQFGDALREYQKALETTRNSSLAHYRIAEVYFLENNYQQAANDFREALNGDLTPQWTEVWAHINLGEIFDITGQRDRAVNEYNLAIRTKDNTQNAQVVAAKYLKTPYERQRKTDQ